MTKERQLYHRYSDYLKTHYGEKVYKLPVQLPVTCPNRIWGEGCSFCAEVGTGFEAMDAAVPVTEQLAHIQNLIEKRYKAKKYIAYFQNYTNTFLPLHLFEQYMREAAAFPNIVAISVSTRPDCIHVSYLDVLQKISEEFHVEIILELGLQTANYHTLDLVHRGHGLAEYIDAVLTTKQYGFFVCTHIILNLPGDSRRDAVETAKLISALGTDFVKLHSLYIAKGTKLAKEYENGTISICSKEEYFNRLMDFLEYLNPQIVVERLFSRIPEEDALFSNWNTSWWKLLDEFTGLMERHASFQGKRFHYLGGSAFKQWKED